MTSKRRRQSVMEPLGVRVLLSAAVRTVVSDVHSGSISGLTYIDSNRDGYHGSDEAGVAARFRLPIPLQITFSIKRQTAAQHGRQPQRSQPPRTLLDGSPLRWPRAVRRRCMYQPKIARPAANHANRTLERLASARSAISLEILCSGDGLLNGPS